MNVSTDSGLSNPLYCELCDFNQFSTYTEFQIHHLTHIRQPLVRLVKLSPNLCSKIQGRSYKVNTGVARTCHVFDHVPPLKLSIVKQQGSNQFSVKRESACSRSNSPNLEENLSDLDPPSDFEESKQNPLLKGLSEVEGKNLLERLGANISISRKVKAPPPEDVGNGGGQNGGKEPEVPAPAVDVKKENVLERLSGIGGISISIKYKAKKTEEEPEEKLDTKDALERLVTDALLRPPKSEDPKKSVQSSQEEASEDGATGGQEEAKEPPAEESGIDILERLTDSLSNCVGAEKSSSEVTHAEISNSDDMEEPLLPGSSVGGIHSQLSASQSDSPLTPEPDSQGEKEQERQEESNNVSDEKSEGAEKSKDCQSQDHGEQQTAFWSDIQNAPNSVDQPQEDPLLTPENPVSNGEGINFLQNFLPDHQSPTGSLPPENSEYMSLDRLGQIQHPQPSYMVNSNDPSSPMEQLKRISNPTPQINVISQHHLQAPPPPPQLHSGVPLSPQQANAYNNLSRIPPHMPPPLYPGYSMYATNYPVQSQMPTPAMQRPMTQRPYPGMASQRPRPRVVKRTAMRPPPPDLTPSKQRRMDSPLQGARPQVQNAPKLPSGITVTPSRKTLEANKVANVLASRGITVTPSRQASRPQQKNPCQSPQVLSIGSGVSITSSANSQNRSNGGFAVPAPRRNSPIVNHHVERPERCTTVDLTQDEDFFPAPRRGLPGRYQCSQCSKIFASAQGLETHRASHRSVGLHKKQSDLAIPIVDLKHPGAREQLLKCGIFNFIPLAQLQSNNNGYFGVPIIQVDTAKEKAVSNLSLLGAGNILVLGKMKALASQPNH